MLAKIREPMAERGSMARQGQGATEWGYCLWVDHTNLCESRYAPMSADTSQPQQQAWVILRKPREQQPLSTAQVIGHSRRRGE